MSALKFSKMPLSQLGYRPFFLVASGFVVLAMGVWVWSYRFAEPLNLLGVPTVLWHAHEMIYGYSFAVIAGFLLTAVQTWTNVPTLRGFPLLLLTGVWVLARLSFFVEVGSLWVPFVADTIFAAALGTSVFLPIHKVRYPGQWSVLAKLSLLGLGNVLFYLGGLGLLDGGLRIGIYSGFYLVLALVITMGQRVIPFFIRSGVGYPVRLQHAKWPTWFGLLMYLGFFGCDVFLMNFELAGWFALGVALAQLFRLWEWHTAGLWRKPLLWSLYCAMICLTLGFGMYFWATVIGGVSLFLAIHLLAVGGIGMMTLGMMARVAWGHSGRDFRHPPAQLWCIFGCIAAAVLFRVLLPILDSSHYTLWVLTSQICWIIAFLGFLWVYLPAFVRPKLDKSVGCLIRQRPKFSITRVHRSI